MMSQAHLESMLVHVPDVHEEPIQELAGADLYHLYHALFCELAVLCLAGYHQAFSCTRDNVTFGTVHSPSQSMRPNTFSLQLTRWQMAEMGQAGVQVAETGQAGVQMAETGQAGAQLQQQVTQWAGQLGVKCWMWTAVRLQTLQVALSALWWQKYLLFWSLQEIWTMCTDVNNYWRRLLLRLIPIKILFIQTIPVMHI